MSAGRSGAPPAAGDAPPLDRGARERVLAHAADVVSHCRKCGIGATRTHAVYGEGDPCARLMVIGEGPGETEDKTGRPFVGRAGELLTKMLAAIDLPREAVYICNTVKCRPTLDEGGRLKNRAPDPQEMANCRPYLDEQIATIRPSVILCLGAPAAKSFLGKTFAITRQRGAWFTGPLGIPLTVTFHPAYVLRQHGPALNETKRLVWQDLKAVRERLDAIATGSGTAPGPGGDSGGHGSHSAVKGGGSGRAKARGAGGGGEPHQADLFGTASED